MQKITEILSNVTTEMVIEKGGLELIFKSLTYLNLHFFQKWVVIPGNSSSTMTCLEGLVKQHYADFKFPKLVTDSKKLHISRVFRDKLDLMVQPSATLTNYTRTP